MKTRTNFPAYKIADKDEKLKNRKTQNKALIEKYPFLRPLNWQLGEIDNYDYEFTEIDNLPDGWKDLHLKDGRFYLDALKDAMLLDKIDIDKARIIQMKEKWGRMVIYPSAEGDNTEKILSEIEEISERTCCQCGAPATKISRGWICPWCDKCAEEESKRRDYPMSFIGIDENPFTNERESI